VTPTSVAVSGFNRIPQTELFAGVVDVRIELADGTVIERLEAGTTSNQRINFSVDDLPANEVIDLCWRGRNAAGATDYTCRENLDLGAVPLPGLLSPALEPDGSRVLVTLPFNTVDNCRGSGTGTLPVGTFYANTMTIDLDLAPLTGYEANFLRSGQLVVPEECDSLLTFRTTPGPHRLTFTVTGANGRMSTNTLFFDATGVVIPSGPPEVQVIDAQAVLGPVSDDQPCADITVTWDLEGDVGKVTSQRIGGLLLPSDARTAVFPTGYLAGLRSITVVALTPDSVASSETIEFADTCLPSVTSDPAVWTVRSTSIVTSGQAFFAGGVGAGIVDVRVIASDGTVIEFPAAGTSDNSFVRFGVDGLPRFDVVDVCWRSRNSVGARSYRCRNHIDLDGAASVGVALGCGAPAADAVTCTFSPSSRTFSQNRVSGVVIEQGTIYAESTVAYLLDGEPLASRCRSQNFIVSCDFTTSPGPHRFTVRATSPSGRVIDEVVDFVAGSTP
jgi:hypothetical protein